jgi:hypothetical protein
MSVKYLMTPSDATSMPEMDDNARNDWGISSRDLISPGVSSDMNIEFSKCLYSMSEKVAIRIPIITITRPIERKYLPLSEPREDPRLNWNPPSLSVPFPWILIH